MKTAFRLPILISVLLIAISLFLWWSIARRPRPTAAKNPPAAPAQVTSETPVTAMASAVPAKIPVPEKAKDEEPAAAPAAPLKRYSEMSIEEGAAIMDQLEAKDLDGIFAALIEACRPGEDGMKMSAIQLMLADELQKRKPDPKFMKRLRDYLDDDEQPASTRGMAIGALGRVATKEAAEILIDVAFHHKNPKIRHSAMTSIDGPGREEGDETFSPEINHLWNEAKDEEAILSVGKAMAKTGAPASIELLLTSALIPYGTDDVLKNATLVALESVRTPNAIPPIVALVEKSKPGSFESYLAFQLLAQIWEDPAKSSFVKWLPKADINVLDSVTNWLGADNYELQNAKAMKALLDSGVAFHSAELRAEVLQAVEQAYAFREKYRKPKR